MALYRTCDHLKEDGVFCQSPALTGQHYCYFHFHARVRRLQAAQARRRGEACRIQFPLVEDMHAVQVSLQQVLDALADDSIDHKRAGLMLYGLQQAAASLNSTPEWKGSRPEVEIDHPLRAVEAPDLESQYQLPFDVNLDATPDVAVAEAERKAGLPSGQQVAKSKHRVLKRIANIRPRFYFKNPDDAMAEPKPVEPPLLKELREALQKAQADQAERLSNLQYSDVEDDDSVSRGADGYTPEQYGEDCEYDPLPAQLSDQAQSPPYGNCADNIQGGPQLPCFGHCRFKSPGCPPTPSFVELECGPKSPDAGKPGNKAA